LNIARSPSWRPGEFTIENLDLKRGVATFRDSMF
jgi:hypothetical protein